MNVLLCMSQILGKPMIALEAQISSIGIAASVQRIILWNVLYYCYCLNGRGHDDTSRNPYCIV